MHSQLDKVMDWEARAETARYRPVSLAQQFGVSIRQLERYFHSKGQGAPRQWLSRLRLREAAVRIKRGEQIKLVALSLEYKQLSHFSREFKRAYGISPTAFVSECIPTTNRWAGATSELHR